MISQTPGRRVHFVSLGCPKNRVDSELMAKRLIDDGHEIAGSAEEADVVVVNTCTFIDAATEESVDTVLEHARLKEEGRIEKLVVTGCMAQRYHEELEGEMPEVDAFVGTGEYWRIGDIVSERTRQPSSYVGLPLYVQQPKEDKVNSLASYAAYLKILEGCPQSCTFCIIPKLRGGLRSRTTEDIVREARLLGAAGVKELNLVGQDSNSFGIDIGREHRLPRLLRELNDVRGIEWIRLLYAYPARFRDELVETLASLPKVCSYVDMPLQHISDPILKSMRRGVNEKKTRRLLDNIRRAMPDVTLRTGFIVGFPGETDADFALLREFIKEQEFDRVGVFTFSPQKGTPAASFEGQVEEHVKQERREELMELQQGIHARKMAALVGTVQEVLVEGPHPETELLLRGRMRSQAPEIDGSVIINEGWAAPGSIRPVRITEAHPYDVVGTLLP